MADLLEEEAEFWLPSDFLKDEVVLMDDKLGKLGRDGKRSAAEFCFPTEFPYDFDSVFNPSDEEDQLAELTRLLSLRQQSHKPPSSFEQKNGFVFGSPQSPLGSLWGRSPGSSNGGSPNSRSLASSPRTTSFAANTDAINLIHEAAGQVAKLKMNSSSNQSLAGPNRHRSSLYLPYLEQVKEVKNPWIHEQQKQMAQNRGCGEPQGAWRSSQYYQQHHLNQHHASANRPAFLGSAGVKKQCAGTGVFLPRCYGTSHESNPASSRKKPGCSPAHQPAKAVQSIVRSHIHPRHTAPCPAEFVSTDQLIARRNAMAMQPRQNLRSDGGLSYELSLPQEWTY